MEVDSEPNPSGGYSAQNPPEVNDQHPTSPTITIKMESPMNQRSASLHTPSTSRHQHIRKTRSSEPAAQDAGHLALPEHGRYRSASPASPIVSAKSMKPALLNIRVTPDPSDSAQAVPSPRTGHRGRSRLGTTPQLPQPQKNMLTVPGMRTKDADSLSSLSSGYYPGSSRSNTASPATPEPHAAHKSWYLETPPDSPRNSCPSPFQRTSSTHRPLSMQNKPADEPKGTSSSDGGRSWQEDNWRRWEDLAQASSDDFPGQETLV
jgi:hypothetical protein